MNAQVNKEILELWFQVYQIQYIADLIVSTKSQECQDETNKLAAEYSISKLKEKFPELNFQIQGEEKNG